MEQQEQAIEKKRKKIREGIESRLASLLVLYGEGSQKAKEDAGELVGAWFQWMDSQGVVIKVEGNLPYCRGLSIIIGDYCRDPLMQRHCPLLKAGYEAVVPLIEPNAPPFPFT